MSLLAAVPAIMSGVGALGGFAQGLANYDMDRKRFNLEKKQMDYMKAQQREAWAREDTAVQRRVHDLKAAGLSPVLAAGQAAQSSSPVQVKAPQKAPRMDIAGQGAVMAGAVMDLLKSREDISKTQEEVKAIKIQNKLDSQRLDYLKEMNPMKVQEQSIRNEFARLSNPVRLRQMNLENEKIGLANARSEIEIRMAELGVTKRELEIVHQRIRNELDKTNWDNQRKELAIKEIAIRLKEVELENKEYNLEWYRTIGLPTSQSLPMTVKQGGVIGTALGNLLDKF